MSDAPNTVDDIQLDELDLAVNVSADQRKQLKAIEEGKVLITLPDGKETEVSLQEIADWKAAQV